MQQMETFTTERLLLKLHTPQVFDTVFTTLSDGEIKSFLALSSEEELAKEKQRFADGAYAQFKNLRWFQLCDRITNEVLGSCGFHIWYKQHSRAEIGYNLKRDSDKQKGLMSEAVAFILDYGFSTMQLNRVEAFVGPDNIPSLKIMAKFGFEKEGYCKEHYCFNGVLDDSVLFALLRKNYNVNKIQK